MQISELINMIDKPDLLNENYKKEIEDLLEEYPYFQTARLLYLKLLRNIRDSRFESELKLTSCYAGDRKKLFFFVNAKDHLPFDLSLMDASDTKEAFDSSFSLVDLFLDDRKNKKEQTNAPVKMPDVRNEMASVDYFSLNDKPQEDDRTVPKLKHHEVIDEFLEKDKEAPVKIDLKNETDAVPLKIPGLNEVEEESFFSETLAKIYLKQKKYGKALEIIKKLHLVYPEKNIYFADQIKFLEKIVNSKK